MKKKCENCAYGVTAESRVTCHFFPVTTEKSSEDWCAQHAFEMPDAEKLHTDLLMLQVTDRTRLICKKLGINTIEDLLLLGKHGIRRNNVPDVESIRDLTRMLDKLGISW